MDMVAIGRVVLTKREHMVALEPMENGPRRHAACAIATTCARKPTISRGPGRQGDEGYSPIESSACAIAAAAASAETLAPGSCRAMSNALASVWSGAILYHRAYIGIAILIRRQAFKKKETGHDVRPDISRDLGKRSIG